MDDSSEAKVIVTEKNNINNGMLFGIGALTVLCLIVSGYIYFNKPNTTLTPVIGDVATQVDSPVVTPWNLAGSIYLTLSPLSGEHIGIYQYNLSENLLTPYYETKNGVAITGKFFVDSSKGNEENLLISQYIDDGSMQIVSIDSKTKEREVLTDSTTKLKRHPVWSTFHNSLVYAGKENDSKLMINPDEFNVYSVDSEGKERKVTSGSIPTLTPDGKSVVVLRSDGLHKVDLMGTSTEFIWPAEGQANLSDQFTISPDGKYIAWSFPSNKKLFLMEVKSWSPFEGQVKYISTNYASWPIFSPDSKYLAFAEFGLGSNDEPVNSYLSIINLLSPTLEKRKAYDLKDFKIQSTFITDWK